MLLKEFPDLKRLRKQAEDRFADGKTMEGIPLRERFELHTTLHRKEDVFNRLLIRAINATSPLEEEETLYGMLILLLKNDTRIGELSKKIPAVKNSTREEVFKRLIASVDYIHSHYDKDVTLAELAAVSCLSKFHFLRLFKEAFGRTPYQFIIEVKVRRAISLLRDSRLSIRDISKSLGQPDPSTFSRLFRKHVGVYPSQFRK